MAQQSDRDEVVSVRGTTRETPSTGYTAAAGAETVDVAIPEAYNLMRDRVRWGPIIAGFLTALTTLVLLGVLGAAIGFSVRQRRRGRRARRRPGGGRPVLGDLGRAQRPGRLRARRLRRRQDGGRLRPPVGRVQRRDGLLPGRAGDAVAGDDGPGRAGRHARQLRLGVERRPGHGPGAAQQAAGQAQGAAAAAQQATPAQVAAAAAAVRDAAWATLLGLGVALGASALGGMLGARREVEIDPAAGRVADR